MASKKDEPKEKTDFDSKQVTLVYDKANAQSVSVAGDFSDWQPERYPLKKDKKGLWTTTIRLAPGRYEYRFVVDGQWANDPKCDERTSNEFGGENCVLHVKTGVQA
jgi:1,4-alpha-glucan branching enzyme